MTVSMLIYIYIYLFLTLFVSVLRASLYAICIKGQKIGLTETLALLVTILIPPIFFIVYFDIKGTATAYIRWVSALPPIYTSNKDK